MKIKCKSVTHAMKGKSVLKSHGITAAVEKTSSSFSSTGCVYSLIIPDTNIAYSLSILKHAKIVLHKTEANLYEGVV